MFSPAIGGEPIVLSCCFAFGSHLVRIWFTFFCLFLIFCLEYTPRPLLVCVVLRCVVCCALC